MLKMEININKIQDLYNLCLILLTFHNNTIVNLNFMTIKDQEMIYR